MKRALAIVSLMIATSSASALDIAGIKLPDSMPVADQQLALNGAGIREKWMFDLYVSGLYLQAPSKDSKTVIAADENQSIRLHIISDKITSERMISATTEGFEKSLDGKAGALQPKIDDFIATFNEAIKVGDYFDLTYVKGEGVHVSKNGAKVKTIAGLDFKQALYGIWLSDTPAQESLKQEMLGLVEHD
jgi:hypothetical protein